MINQLLDKDRPVRNGLIEIELLLNLIFFFNLKCHES